MYALIVILLTSLLIAQSFKAKPIFKNIDQKLKENVKRVVYIPDGINPPAKTFETSTYEWEMETPAGEVSRVRLSYPNAYTKNDQELKVTFELPEGGDASIFDKVLPAVVADSHSLVTALDPQKASEKTQASYTSVNFVRLKTTDQTTKIIWVFPKQNLTKDLQEDYQKLAKYPTSLVKLFYNIPGLLIKLAAG